MSNIQTRALMFSALFGVIFGSIGGAFAIKISSWSYPYPHPIKVYPKNDDAGRMLSIGEYIDGEWRDYIVFKKKSRLYPKVGNPAIVINNIEMPVKTFELGFYNFGPTLATDNEIVEFFIGDSRTGAEYSALSLRSLHAGFGAQLHVRNHADTHSILIDNHSANMSDYDVVVRQSTMEQGQEDLGFSSEQK
jgi:hypothetical protein